MPRPRSLTTRLSVDQLEDRSVPAVNITYAVTQDWGSGFQGQVTLSNTGTAAEAFGTLKFHLPSEINSVWDARVLSHVGDDYTVTNTGWDATVPAGGSVSFGFAAARGNSTAATDFVLGGVTSPVTTLPTTPGEVTFAVANDWGSGLNGTVTIKNTGTAPLTNWQVAFDFPGPITSVWNGTVVSHVGNRYTVKGTAANGTIPAGGSVSFGFVTGVGGVTATNFVLTADSGTVPPLVPVIRTTLTPATTGDAAPTGPKVQLHVPFGTPNVDPVAVPTVLVVLPPTPADWRTDEFAPYVDAIA